MKRRGVVVVVTLLVALGVIVAAVWWFLRHPLAVDAWRTRKALAKAGLEKVQIDAPSGRLTVWEGGDGPPLILLHGAGDQAGAWSEVVGPLMSRHRVVVPDLPGHGESDPSSGPLEVGVVLSGVEAVLEKEAPDGGAVLVGNSLGAWVACLAARDRPQLVKGLVLVNGGPLKGDYAGPSLQPKDRAEARRLMETLMGSQGRLVPWFVLDDVVRQAHSGSIARLAETAADVDGWVMNEDDLTALDLPVHLVWGASDGLFTPEYAERLQKALPNASLHLLDHCGHVPQRQCPDAFVKGLQAALDAETTDASR